jgi:hypothetical protein
LLNQNLISAFIVLALGLQALTAVGFKNKRLWPFIGYPMYASPHPAAEAVPRYTVIGFPADGRELVLTPDDFGLVSRGWTRISPHAR